MDLVVQVRFHELRSHPHRIVPRLISWYSGNRHEVQPHVDPKGPAEAATSISVQKRAASNKNDAPSSKSTKSSPSASAPGAPLDSSASAPSPAPSDTFTPKRTASERHEAHQRQAAGDAMPVPPAAAIADVSVPAQSNAQQTDRVAASPSKPLFPPARPPPSAVEPSPSGDSPLPSATPSTSPPLSPTASPSMATSPKESSMSPLPLIPPEANLSDQGRGVGAGPGGPLPLRPGVASSDHPSGPWPSVVTSPSTDIIALPPPSRALPRPAAAGPASQAGGGSGISVLRERAQVALRAAAAASDASQRAAAYSAAASSAASRSVE